LKRTAAERNRSVERNRTAPPPDPLPAVAIGGGPDPMTPDLARWIRLAMDRGAAAGRG
jgi:hypothetical protein